MRILAVFFPPLAPPPLPAGGAGMRSGGTTTAMGAGPAPQTVMCRDAAWVANASECGNHGGVERAMGSSTAK